MVFGGIKKALNRAKKTILKFIGVKSQEERIAQQIEETGRGNVDRHIQELRWKHSRIIDRIKQLEYLARLEEQRYRFRRAEENARLYADYIELSRQYREMMGELLHFVEHPERIDDDRLKPLQLVRDLISVSGRYNELPEGTPSKPLYRELTELLVDWSQEILLNKYLSHSDVNRVLQISLSESVDIHAYAREFPEIFSESELPAEIFSEVVVFIAYSYAILNKVELPNREHCPVVISQYAMKGDIKALRDMSKYLLENAEVIYYPAIIAEPDTILSHDPEWVSVIIEYSENFISQGKATRYETMDVYPMDRWSEFLDRLTTIKEIYEDTQDIDFTASVVYPNELKGISVSNIMIGVKRGKK